jgi:Cu(I)/Ag(I) efflux system membrane fusion protein/cobalt-zinc-cadmium efflux system membrane fusion protein
MQADKPMKKFSLNGVLAALLLASIVLNIYLIVAETPSEDMGASMHAAEQLYTCGMHPEVIQEGPGSCPLCGMDLTPVKSSAPPSVSTLYTCGMHPEVVQEGPGNCPLCGMDLVPMHKEGAQAGAVSIDPVTLQNIGVTMAHVERRDLAVEMRSNGIVMVAEDAEVRVNPKISGWIEKLYVSKTGDFVRKDNPLLEIYSPELVAAQEEYLLATQSFRTLQSSSLENVSGDAEKLLHSAKRRLELWDISEDQINEIQKTGAVQRTMILRSPASGVVLHKNAVEGAAVKVGQDLFRIADLDPIWIEAQIYEHELPWVKSGDDVKVKSPYQPGSEYAGKVDYIYPYLDEKSRTVKVRIVLPNPGFDLRPGMYVDAVIRTEPLENILAVPKNSVIRSGSRDLVFVLVGEGQFSPREVELGVESDRYFEVRSGLQPGEAVVIAAQFLLDSEASLQEAIQRRLEQRGSAAKAPAELQHQH